MEVAGIALGSVPVLLNRVPGGREAAKDWVRRRKQIFKDTYREDGIIVVLLLAALPKSGVTLERIQRVLSGTTAAGIELLQFRQSLSSNFNMVAVAVGAIPSSTCSIFISAY